MSAEAITALLKQAAFSFIGTVEELEASTVPDIPVDARTAVVRVDRVLHAPEAFSRLAGSKITAQLAEDADPPAVGESLALFANGLAFGESLAVSEVGRLAVAEVEPHIAAADEAQAGTSATGAAPFAALQQQAEIERLREHAGAAEAVVLARVVKLEKAIHTGFSEHDPDWWLATIDVHHVEQGALEPGEVGVLYPNSQDVRWLGAPKPKAGQDSLWVLHATAGEQRNLAPFRVEHAEDYLPTQSLRALRGENEAQQQGQPL